MAQHVAYMVIPKADLDANAALYIDSQQAIGAARQTIHGVAKNIISVLTDKLIFSSVASKYTAYFKLSEAEVRLEVDKDEWKYYAQAATDADSVGQQFLVGASLVGKVKAGDKIKIAGSTRHNGTYTVSAVSAGAITVSEAVATKVAGDVFGNLLYQTNR